MGCYYDEFLPNWHNLFAQHPNERSQENASLMPGTIPALPLAAETRSGKLQRWIVFVD